jgi:nicotinate-nucleotide adenylyltransferase
MSSAARVRPVPPEPAPVADNASPGVITRTALRPPPACAAVRIGLLGGSFNPAHEGHLHISEFALKRLRLDRVWWLVTPANPLKERRELAPLADRLAGACHLARHPRIEVTAFEAARPDAYTINTVRFLTARYPATRFVWLMGADALAGFHLWRDWRGIAARVPLAVFDRPGYRYAACASRAAHALARDRLDESDAGGLADLLPPIWAFLTLPLSPVSSTELRRRG